MDRDELIARLVAAAKEYATLFAAGESNIYSITANEVMLSESAYREWFPDYRDHEAKAQLEKIKVSHMIDGVTFFALFTPRIKGEPKDLI